ncbi:MAG: hypothetical protein WCL44_13610 [bacterium]
MSAGMTDREIVRALARQYAEIAAYPVQDERRRLWAAHNSLKRTRVPVLTQTGFWQKWAFDHFGDARMQCQDPFLRDLERYFRLALFQFDLGDDTIQEPWFTVNAHQARGWRNIWGLSEDMKHPENFDGAYAYQPPLKEWSDMAKLSPPPHQIDEDATRHHADRVREVIGDLLEINVDRGPVCQGFMSDISTSLAGLRGLEQIMIDMYESPDELKRLLAFMRDGILANNDAAERAGDYSLTTQSTAGMTYTEDREPPRANSGARPRSQLWAFCAAQELAQVSPAMHEEFMFNYQLPIYEHFGMVAYGCCEDLTRKISFLRRMKSLRTIGVTPWADVAKCAEQIGTDYVFGWRPNPTDQVCADWDESRIRRILREGLEASRGCIVHIHLKDVENLRGDPTRLKRWVAIAREVVEGF